MTGRVRRNAQILLPVDEYAAHPLRKTSSMAEHGALPGAGRVAGHRLAVAAGRVIV